MSEEPKIEPEEQIPESAVELEVSGTKQKMVSVDVLSAERKRVREATEQKFQKDLDALKVKADQADKLAADLESLRPDLEFLKNNPQIRKAQEPPELAAINDAEAESFAREWEIYDARGLNLPKAKQMLAKQRAEMTRVAQAAAAEAVKPAMNLSAQQQSRANFLAMANKRNSQGQPLVDPQILAGEWQKVPMDLSQHPEVAEHLLRVAIAEQVLSGKTPPPVPSHEPIFTEGPGGQRQGAYQISDIEKRMARVAGMTEKDFTATAKTYQPDTENVLGD